MTAGAILNDKHSKLNATRFAEVLTPANEEDVIAAIREAGRNGARISICGGRHAMGGQQFGTDTVLLDLCGLRAFGEVDEERGLVEVGAGMMWPELIETLISRQVGKARVWSIRQKQTGADDLTLGGSLAANIHGRGLGMKPIIDDVEAFTLIDGSGDRYRCCRSENVELFGLVIGGYGCFGVITSIQLRLTPRSKLERLVEITTIEKVITTLAQREAEGCLYGDFQFSIDEKSEGFLNEGVLSSYRPVHQKTVMPEVRNDLVAEDWEELIHLAHHDRAKVFEVYSQFYLNSNKSLYWSDTHQLSVYLENYHAKLDHDCGAKVPASEMISELYVPREYLPIFMKAAGEELKRRRVPVIYGTVRLILRDDESFLTWAREDFACVIFNLHTDHDERGIARSSDAFRALIDLALGFGGSYYLTYHRWARLDQVSEAHPRMREFLAHKDRYDPDGRFQSNWWRHHRNLFQSK